METIISIHPEVQFVWDFWPFNLLIWWPIRAVLNLIFFWAWPFVLPFYTVWNFIPTTAGIIAWFTLGFSLLVSSIVFFSTVWLWITITYLYITAQPDIFIMFELLIFISILIYIISGLTGDTFSFIEIGKSSWLVTKEMKNAEGIDEKYH